jgi:D-glycero-D-manno-heptose 1,7-bisphosphate phosphatase
MTQKPQVEEHAVPVLYLDLDGTVRQGKDDTLGRFVNGPEDVVVFPEAVQAPLVHAPEVHP